jgi:AcrR family transcriptional regulator
MARPIVIANEKILKAAQEVFLREGYRAATSKIAERAGVSEGTLFKRFKSKAELFLAAMDLQEGDRSWMDRLASYDPERDQARAFLKEAATALLAHLNVMLPKFMALKASGLDPEDLKAVFSEPPPLRHLRALTGFFEKTCGLKVGASRRAKILATAFQGALLHYVMCRHRFGYIPMDEPEYLEGLLDLYLPDTRRSA